MAGSRALERADRDDSHVTNGYLSTRKILKLRNESCSLVNFGVSLMLSIFLQEELLDRTKNVTGRGVKGGKVTDMTATLI